MPARFLICTLTHLMITPIVMAQNPISLILNQAKHIISLSLPARIKELHMLLLELVHQVKWFAK